MKKKYVYKWLNNGVDAFIRDHIPAVNYFTALIRKNWHEIVGTAMASHSTPISINNRVLTINVDDPLWIQEFTLYKDEIKDKIMIFFRDNSLEAIFSTIRFQNGEIRKPENNAKTVNSAKIDPESLKKIDDSLSKIEDNDLKNALRHYFIQSQVKFTKD